MTRDQLEIEVHNAIYLCYEKNYDTCSPAFFQRSLALDFSEGLKVFMGLVQMGIITNYWLDDDSDDEENYIGEIDRNKLKEHLRN